MSINPIQTTFELTKPMTAMNIPFKVAITEYHQRKIEKREREKKNTEYKQNNRENDKIAPQKFY